MTVFQTTDVFGTDLTQRQPSVVRKRAVFFIGGYDPKSPDAFYDRLDRESQRYSDLYKVTLTRSQSLELKGGITRHGFEAKSFDDETVETDFHFVSLDDIVLTDFAHSFDIRFWRYLKTFSSYMISGTGFAFIKHAWRFSLYFFYPMMALVLMAIISLIPALLIANSGVALSWLMAPVIFLATFSALIRMVAPNYFVLHLMDLWSFSYDFIRRSRDDIDTKLTVVSEAVVNIVDQGDHDEILLIGHSTGGALILDLAARAIGQRGDANISVLTVGSTALKIGLHPAAIWFRERVSAFVSAPNTQWVEYQCRTDLINFFRTNPATLMGIDVADKPVIGEIRIRRMVADDVYRKFRRNFFRVHYQFVFGNTKPYHYDFPDICFGPTPIAERAGAGADFLRATPKPSETA